MAQGLALQAWVHPTVPRRIGAAHKAVNGPLFAHRRSLPQRLGRPSALASDETGFGELIEGTEDTASL